MYGCRDPAGIPLPFAVLGGLQSGVSYSYAYILSSTMIYWPMVALPSLKIWWHLSDPFTVLRRIDLINHLPTVSGWDTEQRSVT